jgi:hypothetical protein
MIQTLLKDLPLAFSLTELRLTSQICFTILPDMIPKILRLEGDLYLLVPELVHMKPLKLRAGLLAILLQPVYLW